MEEEINKMPEGAIYIDFTDGKFYKNIRVLNKKELEKVEVTLEEVREIEEVKKLNKSDLEYQKRVLDTSIEYIKHVENLSIGSFCKEYPEFDSVINIDLFIEDFRNAFISQKITKKEILFILEIWIHKLKEDIKNPIKKKTKSVNKYFLRKLIGLREQIKSLSNDKILAKNNLIEPNDFDKSTIEEHFYYKDQGYLKDKFHYNSYNLLVDCLYSYFKDGYFPQINQTIAYTGNKKKLGSCMKNLYLYLKGHDEPFTKAIDYLLFFKSHVTCFKEDKFDENNVTGSQLYKNFTTKTL